MTGKTPRYSIITSAYNQRQLLQRVEEGLKSQTLQDFEWIIADDGSSDGTENWINDRYKYVWQKDQGYDLVGILNKAGELVEGDYMVWIMADSKPRPNFLEKMDEVVDKNRMVTGLRMNYNDDGEFVGPDWRIHAVVPNGRNALKIENDDHPWGWMTLNTMCVPTKAWRDMGGIPKEYKGYGKMDWWMAAWCYFNGYEMWWATEAVVEHLHHEQREDSEENTLLFDKHVKEMRNASNN